jgi:ankyrin repeat protein
VAEAGASIDLGPRRRPPVAVGLDPRSPDRLVIRRHPPAGCLVVVAGALAVVAAAGGGVPGPGGISWSWLLGRALPLGALAAVLLARRWLIIDRNRREIERGIGAVWPWRRTIEPLGVVQAVRLERHDEAHPDADGDSSVTTTYGVSLERDGQNLEISRAGVWECAVPLGETLAHFLRVGLDDRSQRRRRSFEELETPLCDQRPPSRKGAHLKPSRLRVVEGEDGSLVIEIPRSKDPAYLAGALAVFVLWTLPVSIFGSLWLGLLPLGIMIVSWLKVAYGYSAEVRVSADGLTVTSRGLVMRSTVSIPCGELEELILIRPEWGGPRNTLAFAFAGMLVARSDRSAVRFGHGLTREELQWLRALITQRLVELGLDHAEWQPTFETPTLPSPWRPLLGLAIGAAAAAIVGGPLAICVAAPFVEHVLNLGGVLGFFAGLMLHARRFQSIRPSRIAIAALLVISLGWALVVAYPEAGVLAPAPQYDEWSTHPSDDATTWIARCGWAAGAAGAGLGGWMALAGLLWAALRLGPRSLRLARALPLGRIAVAGSALVVIACLVAAWLARGQLLLAFVHRGWTAGVRVMLDLDGGLLGYQDPAGDTPLHHAVARNRLELVELLLARGADPRVRAYDGETPLHCAYHGVDAVRMLLAAGVEVDAQEGAGRTALMYECARGEVESVRELLKAGASPDMADRQGLRPLHCGCNQPAVVSLLLERGVQVDAATADGRTALMMASAGGSVDSVRLLLDAGADPNRPDASGRTALHWVATSRATWARDVAEALLAHGADPELLDGQGRTPHEVAERDGRDELAEVLARGHEGAARRGVVELP